jgi:hypothetical protein
MSIAREEFLRLLPSAVGPFDVDPVSEAPALVFTAPRWTIHVAPLPRRRLGSVVVPRHRVDITLEGCSEGEGEAFMDRFHRAFLRGGG